MKTIWKKTNFTRIYFEKQRDIFTDNIIRTIVKSINPIENKVEAVEFCGIGIRTRYYLVDDCKTKNFVSFKLSFLKIINISITSVIKTLTIVKNLKNKKNYIFPKFYESQKRNNLYYDTYLNFSKDPTFTNKLIYLFYSILILEFNFRLKKLLIDIVDPSYVVIPQRVDTNNGPLAIISSEKKLPIYSYGYRDGFISVIKDPSFYAKEYSCNRIEAENIYNKYKKLSKESKSYLFGKALESGFTPSIEGMFYTQLTEVNQPKKEKVIGVFSHVFQDWPKSHDKEIFFKDYFEWLDVTLATISQSTEDYKWIIKFHPHQDSYSRKRNYTDSLKSKYSSKNIYFLPYDDKLTMSDFSKKIDTVITNRGSAAVEFAAIFKKPCLYFSGSYYSTFSFGNCAESTEEYLRILRNPDLIRLTQDDHTRAETAFIYCNYLTRIFVPEFKENDYFHRLDDKHQISSGLELFINQLGRVDFSRTLNPDLLNLG